MSEYTVNVSGNEAGSVTEALPSPTNVLKKLRTKHGYDSEVGHRCSNILEIMDGMPRPPEEWIDYLMPDWVPEKYTASCKSIAVQTADLHKLLAAQELT